MVLIFVFILVVIKIVIVCTIQKFPAMWYVSLPTMAATKSQDSDKRVTHQALAPFTIYLTEAVVVL